MLCSHPRQRSHSRLEVNKTWVEAEADAIIQRSPIVGSWSRPEIVRRIDQQVNDWMKFVEPAPDNTFGQRPGTNPAYWDIAEHYANRALDGNADLPEPQATVLPQKPISIWSSPVYGRSFFYRRLVGDRLEKRHLHINPLDRFCRMETSWLRGANAFWARGVVALEGAARAFLRRQGFGLHGRAGEFWQEIGWTNTHQKSPQSAIPAWRWQLSREAYLASFIWAWGELLNSSWSPFDLDCRRELRRALTSTSAMFGWNGRSALAGKEVLRFIDRKYMVQFVDNGTVNSRPGTETFWDKARRIIPNLISAETAFCLPDPQTGTAGSLAFRLV